MLYDAQYYEFYMPNTRLCIIFLGYMNPDGKLFNTLISKLRDIIWSNFNICIVGFNNILNLASPYEMLQIAIII